MACEEIVMAPDAEIGEAGIDESVIELSVLTTHKGTALNALRMQLSASAVLFLGDDVTDENAFGELHGPDVGIKIGAGPTAADIPRALRLVRRATVAWLVSSALLTLASGQLYAHFGAHGFWVMTVFCAAALPVARTLRQPAGEPSP